MNAHTHTNMRAAIELPATCACDHCKASGLALDAAWQYGSDVLCATCLPLYTYGNRLCKSCNGSRQVAPDQINHSGSAKYGSKICRDCEGDTRPVSMMPVEPEAPYDADAFYDLMPASERDKSPFEYRRDLGGRS
jgi:hypothetical protein